MELVQAIIAFLIIILAIPVGYLLKMLTPEEMFIGRIYFQIIWISCLIIAFIMLFIGFNNTDYKYAIIATLLFMAIVSFISYYSNDNRKNRN